MKVRKSFSFSKKIFFSGNYSKFIKFLNRGLESKIAYTKVSGVVSQYTLLCPSLSCSLNSIIPKNKQNFSFPISVIVSEYTLSPGNLV